MSETAADAATGIPTRLLVMGLVHEDGTLLAADVYPVAEACGQSAEQVRSCLRRLVSEGLFTREGEGREARFHTTESGMRAMGSNLERQRLAYVQDQAGKGWDRRWRLVAFAVPEAKRAARDALRDLLLTLGGAAVHNGLYLSPHRWEKDVQDEASRLGVAEHVAVASTDDLEIGGERDPRAIAERLWPIADVATGYERFLASYGDLPDRLEEMRRRKERIPDAAFLPGALAMGVAFQACFARDPLLPPELLPRPWPGRAARDVVVRSRRLSLLMREEHDRPALFRSFDDLVERIP